MDAEGRVMPAGGERRRYWLCVAALAAVLPATMAVHAWGSLVEWRARNASEPVAVERGSAQPYAGGRWRLTGLSPLRTGSPDQTVVLAEFEAVIDDPAAIAESPCLVALSDAQGRRWEPRFMAEPVVREMHPEAADKPRCGVLAFEGVAKGATARMAESFLVPADAEGLELSITMLNARPRYLVLR